MMKHFLIPMIATAGLLVVAVDARSRFFAPRGPLRAVDAEDGRDKATGRWEAELRPGLRRLAQAVESYEERHRTPPPDRESLSEEFPGEEDLWSCPRCRKPYLLGPAESSSGESLCWPFGTFPARPGSGAPAVCCGRCVYPDGTTDVLTFDGSIGSMPREEALRLILREEAPRHQVEDPRPRRHRRR